MSAAVPSLVVICDWSLGERALLASVEALGSAFRDRVGFQHRHPAAGGRVFLEQARALAAICDRYGSPLFANGRLDVALLVGAHLHLPAQGPDVDEVRALLPSERLISVAVHDPAEATRARGADFAFVSPVFGAGSKPEDTRAPLGVEGFARLAAVAPCPAFALGGVGPENVSQLRGSGARGVAAISSVLRSPRPVEAAAALLDGLLQGSGRL